MGSFYPEEEIATAYEHLIVPAAEATNEWLANLSQAMGAAVISLTGEGTERVTDRASYYVTREVNGAFAIDYPKLTVKSIRMVRQCDLFAASAEPVVLATAFTVNVLSPKRGEAHDYDTGVSWLEDLIPRSSLHPPETNRIYTIAGIGSIVPMDPDPEFYTSIEAMTADNTQVFLNRLVLGSHLWRMVFGAAAKRGIETDFEMDAAADQAAEMWRAIRPDIAETAWRPYYLDRVAALA